MITLEDLKKYLNITTTEEDDTLKYIVDGVNQLIIRYLGRNIEQQDYVEYINGKGEKEILLKNYPVNEIKSVQINTGSNTNPNWVEVDKEMYKLGDKNIGRVYFYHGLIKGVQNYKIVYNAGYSSIPADLKLAGLKLCKQYINKVKAEGISGESNNGDSIRFLDIDMGLDVINILNNYKNYNV